MGLEWMPREHGKKDHFSLLTSTGGKMPHV
jgi:hypothetical protein